MAELGVVGSLGEILENDPLTRQQARSEKKLTSWPDKYGHCWYSIVQITCLQPEPSRFDHRLVGHPSKATKL